MCETSASLRNADLSPNKEDHHQTNLPGPPSKSSKHSPNNEPHATGKQNQVGNVLLFGVPIVSLVMDAKERLCLAQISSTLLKEFSYNEIHNRRVALGITCVQCTPVQLEILRRAGAMPVTSRRCGMITRREAERLCQSFLGDHAPPQLPENFAFEVYHECGWGCRGSFVPSRYNSSRAKCIRCTYCQLFFSPNKFIFHSHRLPESRYVQPDAANFNSWRRHLKLCGDPPDDDASSNTLSMDTAQIVHAWEDVRAMFNGGTRKRMLAAHSDSHHQRRSVSKQVSSSASPQANSSHSSSRSPPSHNPHHLNSSNTKSSNHSSSNNHSHSHPIHQHHHSGHHPTFDPPHPPPVPTTTPTNLLAPSSVRLDTIWNPGLSSTPPGVRISSSQGLPGSSSTLPHPHLPFHPLSIPWLRRPLFPFPHPFSPAAFLGDPTGASMPEKLRQQMNHSAFKPVSRTPTEHLFSWLNNNSPGLLGSLPEDLSLHSSTPTNNNLVNFTPSSGSLDDISVTSNSPYKDKVGSHPSIPSTNDSLRHKKRHQIQLVSNSSQNETDDEETVDIEEVEEEECCSSTSSVWLPKSSSNSHAINTKRKASVDSCSTGGDDEDDDDLGSPKRKRLWDFDSSGESGGGGGNVGGGGKKRRATGEKGDDPSNEV